MKDSVTKQGIGELMRINLVPEWYHLEMAMNLRLTPEQTAALKKAAAEDGISMQEAALKAIDNYTSRRRQLLLGAIEKIRTEDAELLRRLAK
jgi:predicted DNA binding CopG/RHH family protein